MTAACDRRLQDCSLGDEGVCALALALSRGNLPKLTCLYLMGNAELTDVCAYALAAAIQKRKRMPMIRDIRLGYTKVSVDGKAAIEGAAKGKGTVCEVQLSILGGLEVGSAAAPAPS